MLNPFHATGLFLETHELSFCFYCQGVKKDRPETWNGLKSIIKSSDWFPECAQSYVEEVYIYSEKSDFAWNIVTNK